MAKERASWQVQALSYNVPCTHALRLLLHLFFARQWLSISTKIGNIYLSIYIYSLQILNVLPMRKRHPPSSAVALFLLGSHKNRRSDLSPSRQFRAVNRFFLLLWRATQVRPLCRQGVRETISVIYISHEPMQDYLKHSFAGSLLLLLLFLFSWYSLL